MSHFAKVENGVVTSVIVAEQDFINSGAVGDPSLWIQTSYNTRNNTHALGGTPLRGNYAGIGYIYDSVNDIFMPPKPYNSWSLDVATASWKPPVDMPNDGNMHTWNEETMSWDPITENN